MTDPIPDLGDVLRWGKPDVPGEACRAAGLAMTMFTNDDLPLPRPADRPIYQRKYAVRALPCGQPARSTREAPMTHPDTAPRRDLLTDIGDAADALTDPHQHTEPRWEWDANRNRKPLKPHTTTVRGLIEQLRDATEPGVDGEHGGGGGPESCPANIEAVSLLASIEFGAAIRCRQAGIAIRPTAEDNIRALVGAAPRLPSRPDPDQPEQASQWALRAELRSWQHQAEVLTGWKAPARMLPAPCMHCDARGTLLARVGPEAQQAVCIACDNRWDGEAEMAVLGRHVADYRARADAAAREARTRAVEERRRREGHPPETRHAGQRRTAA